MPKILDDEQIYLAVIRTIAERGYSGATTRQIAENAGISEVTLFRKFDTKVNLVKQSIEFVIGHLGLYEAAKFTGDLETDLHRMVKAYYDAIKEIGDFVTVIISEGSKTPELQTLFMAPSRMFQKFGQVIAKYQQQGKLKKEHPLHAVGSLFSPIIFTLLLGNLQSAMDVPPLDIENHVKKFLDGRRIIS
ncbi:MAG: TetR/AcrR family transcriptional regulator [Methanobacteriota archaeon]|nr:MAG: TetR/AcrR family transcriptional regulator [Euryarchaeota archaeon]